MILMNDMLADYLDDFVVVFLDDILIYSKTLEDHAIQLRKVLQKLRDHQLYAKAPKHEIAYKSIEFLRQHVTPAGMSPTKAKIKVVQEWDTGCKGRQIVPWICQLLSAVYSLVHRSSPPIDRIDE